MKSTKEWDTLTLTHTLKKRKWNKTYRMEWNGIESNQSATALEGRQQKYKLFMNFAAVVAAPIHNVWFSFLFSFSLLVCVCLKMWHVLYWNVCWSKEKGKYIYEMRFSINFQCIHIRKAECLFVLFELVIFISPVDIYTYFGESSYVDDICTNFKAKLRHMCEYDCVCVSMSQLGKSTYCYTWQYDENLVYECEKKCCK